MKGYRNQVIFARKTMFFFQRPKSSQVTYSSMFLEAEDEQTPRNLNEHSCHYNIIKINNEVRVLGQIENASLNS